jgi:hypothetical protein
MTSLRHGLARNLGFLGSVGDAWPTDSAQWKISDNDGVLMLDAGQLELFIEPAG